MSRPAAKKHTQARVALVGAEAPEGVSMRQALAESGVPGERVDLYGSSDGDMLISEYAGEARLIQQPDIEEIISHDLVLLCEKSQLSLDVFDAAGASSLVIDVVGCLEQRQRLPMVQANVNMERARDHAGALSTPHPLAGVLAELLHPLECKLGLSEVIGMIVRPASDFGEEGLAELKSQTIDLLNFEKVQIKTFGKQLAFNLLPGEPAPPGALGLEKRVEDNVARLLGWDDSRIAIRFMVAPIFYGHCLQLRLRFQNGVGLAEVQSSLGEAASVSQSEDLLQVSPLDMVAQKQIRLAPVTEDGLGGYWLWAVTGGLAERHAEHVLTLANALNAL